MMATLRRLIGLVDRSFDDDDTARRAREQSEQVARLLADITAQTARLQKRGFNGGRPDPGAG